MSDLNYWLGRDYHARNVGTSVDDKIAAMFEADPTMKIEAGKRLASLTDAITKKDYISKINRECLERVLGKA